MLISGSASAAGEMPERKLCETITPSRHGDVGKAEGQQDPKGMTATTTSTMIAGTAGQMPRPESSSSTSRSRRAGESCAREGDASGGIAQAQRYAVSPTSIRAYRLVAQGYDPQASPVSELNLIFHQRANMAAETDAAAPARRRLDGPARSGCCGGAA